jgi:hypothetical protein
MATLTITGPSTSPKNTAGYTRHATPSASSPHPHDSLQWTCTQKKRGTVMVPFKFGRGRLPARTRGWWAFRIQTALVGGSSVAEDETIREVAVRGSADGALREVASQ